MRDRQPHAHALLQREHLRLGSMVCLERLRGSSQVRAQGDGISDGQLPGLRPETSDANLLRKHVHVRSLD
jgi:hypothetical protein